ncbi:hypothetical protein FRC03_005329 [Tulasnella sp. 419]|nr:hypothetical protein FRC03_005329 [Tulasnella sp. 419]
MSSVVNLPSLNWDVLLGIVEHEIDVPTLISLRSTCKNLYNFVNIKSTWITVLKNLSKLHPINLPSNNPNTPLSSLSLSQMMSIAVKTHNLRQNWLSPTPEPRPSFQVVALPPTYSIVSILLVPHSPYLLVLSESSRARASSTVTCIDLQRGKPIATCSTNGVVSSWRAEVTSEDSIAICLLIGPEDRLAIS